MIVEINGETIELDIVADTFVPEDVVSLQKEACRTPGLLARYGEMLADLKANTERAKFDMDEVSSFVADSTRKTSDEKLTVDRLKEIVALDNRVSNSKNVYIKSMRNMHAIDNTLKALHKKADIITTLLYQHRQEMKLYGQI
jgi:hypothetical protein